MPLSGLMAARRRLHHQPIRLDITDDLIDALIDARDDTLVALRAALLRELAAEQTTGSVNGIASPFAYDLEDALADLEREYLYGEISREEWFDRRKSHIALFAERVTAAQALLPNDDGLEGQAPSGAAVDSRPRRSPKHEPGCAPVCSGITQGTSVFPRSKDGAMSNEQDQPYEEAGLIDHHEEDDEDEDAAAENPFADQQTQRDERQQEQQSGVTERISEEIDRRISQSEDELNR
jgi:hypothetical protein